MYFIFLFPKQCEVQINLIVQLYLFKSNIYNVSFTILYNKNNKFKVTIIPTREYGCLNV